MWRLYCSIITLFLILTLCFFTAHWIENTTNQYIQWLEQAQEHTRNGEWMQATELTKQAFTNWEEQSFPLYILLRHSDIDKIQLCFQTVFQYLEQEDEEPYRANNAQLITQLQLLSEMEQCTLENIL